MKKKIFFRSILISMSIFIFILFYSVNTFANDSSSTLVLKNYKQRVVKYLRPYLNNFIGNEKTNLILGKTEFMLDMPKVSLVTKSAFDISGYKKVSNVSKKHISESDKKKYGAYYVKELLSVVVKKKVESSEFAKWYSTLLQGGSREGIYHALVLSSHYRRLENFKLPLTDVGYKFAKKMFVKFFQKSNLSSEFSMEKLDFYKLKRIVVENCLTIVDNLIAQNRVNDAYKWDAILNTYLAKNYSTFFASKMRRDENLKSQFVWSQNVPLQILKSELIIRLHIVFNNLQHL